MSPSDGNKEEINAMTAYPADLRERERLDTSDVYLNQDRFGPGARENEELRRQASRPREFTGPRPLAQLRPVPTAGGTRIRLA